MASTAIRTNPFRECRACVKRFSCNLDPFRCTFQQSQNVVPMVRRPKRGIFSR